ncbi:acyltransferase family protein [uncultured Dokdonia sp.]|uniref:acyltransferase n=1 Tax=uncultured Dokdonia sp. TaxID=575653 RepID=UPI00260E6AC9|nr:acyltransferase family protein [uncultured Dokdonia sp.]
MIKNSKQSQIWPNNLRAIATISVILLHVSAPILSKFSDVSIYTWQIGNIYDSLSRYCVPVFFMLSGALLLNKDYKLEIFIKKRFFRIIPPFIFWSIVYIIYKIIDINKDFNSVIDLIFYFIRNLFNGSQYHLWFIYTLLGLYLLMPILRKWIKHASKKEIQYFLLIWSITIIYAIPRLKGYLPKLYLVNFSGFLGYMILGFYLSKLNSFKTYKLLTVFSLSLIFTILGTYYLSIKNLAFNEVLYGYLMPNVLINSIALFLLIKQVNIKSKPITYILSKISMHSYGIYLIHVLILSLLSKIGLDWRLANPLISIPSITILTVLISTLSIHLGKKIKFISKLIG